MKYNIVSDIPGRIRVRTGKFAFTLEQCYSITERLCGLTYVIKSQASHLTGSVLVYYAAGHREELLNELDALNPGALPPVKREHGDTYEIDLSFKYSVAGLILRHLAKKLFLPLPVRAVITIARSLGYIRAAVKSLARGKLGVEVLDATAISVSILQGNTETASSIMFLLKISELLENYTRKKTRSALTESLAINVDSVWRVNEDGDEEPIPMSRLQLGDRIVIRTGAMIPVDGYVTSGEAMVNQSSMTGEPMAVFKDKGDSVFAGTVVEDGALTIQVRSLSGDSRIMGIVNLIDQSEVLKAQFQGRAELVADRIVPLSFLLCGAVFALTGNATKAISVLLVDYSCAIKLTAPISVISAMREAADHRILVKGGKYLEAMAEADTIVFDKTGTLTVASPKVSGVIAFGENQPREVLRIAACLEEHFPHSVAQAIVGQAELEELCHEEMHTEVEYLVAHGIATTIDGKRAIIGSEHFIFEDEGVLFLPEDRKKVEQEIGGDSVIYLAIDNKAMGAILISDPPRPEAKEVIGALKELGIDRTVMLTGDSEATAKAVARELGIRRYLSQVLPEDKAIIVDGLKIEGRRVIMVGDGVNDSPALAAAHVSVAMKDSSDIAREVADITLLSSDLWELVTLRRLSQRMLERVKSNYRFILTFNSALLILGLMGVITPSMSALLHNTSTMALGMASMRRLLPPSNGKEDV